MRWEFANAVLVFESLVLGFLAIKVGSILAFGIGFFSAIILGIILLGALGEWLWETHPNIAILLVTSPIATKKFFRKIAKSRKVTVIFSIVAILDSLLLIAKAYA